MQHWTRSLAIARIRKHYPKAWAWDIEAAKVCTGDYLTRGWLALVPESCRGETLLVPIDFQWAYAGWPNRTIQRMAGVGARIVVTGPRGGGDMPRGLDLPEQIGEVPASFNGFVWVDDIAAIGPALRPFYNRRPPEEEAALEKALERRRAARD